MPAARVACLVLFVATFMGMWSNDPGLRAEGPATVTRPTSPSAVPSDPPRPRMADGDGRTSVHRTIPLPAAG
jgi:hypothetical protein